jgi:hypothetical protein
MCSNALPSGADEILAQVSDGAIRTVRQIQERLPWWKGDGAAKARASERFHIALAALMANRLIEQVDLGSSVAYRRASERRAA